jgi:hypothetical protein
MLMAIMAGEKSGSDTVRVDPEAVMMIEAGVPSGTQDAKV